MDSDNLSDLFVETSVDRGAQRMIEALEDPTVSQLCVNRYDRVWVTNHQGTQLLQDVFAGPSAYIRFLDYLMSLTDVGYKSVETARTSVIEGSFNPAKTQVQGSIHIATKEVTRMEPVLTVRKQPKNIVTLDNMFSQGMFNEEMRAFLEIATRGRLNIVVSGGSGAGKTTLARALSQYIDGSQRVLTAEEIDELHLSDWLPNVVSLTTYKDVDEFGRVIRKVELDDLVREALRMRADRIWVGETRGKEAFALVKACNSGHDGSCTTLHADDGQQAARQLVTYVMESGLAEEVARDQVQHAFHLVVQIAKVRMGRRVVTEISELEAVREGSAQRIVPLYRYDQEQDTFLKVGMPTRRIVNALERYGVNLNGYNGF